MPKPNCTEEIDVGPIDFGQLGRRVVEWRFDGGSMTSDGGVMLLGQVDRKLGLMDAAARCSADKCPATQAGEGSERAHGAHGRSKAWLQPLLQSCSLAFVSRCLDVSLRCSLAMV